METPEVQQHIEAWLPPNLVGAFGLPYQPTFGRASYINDYHRRLAAGPHRDVDGMAIIASPIPGWLRVEEALKLYEMAYYSQGDILEIGTYQGLSATFMSQAIAHSGRPRAILSVDISVEYITAARRYIDKYGVGQGVHLLCCDARDAVEWLTRAGRQFGFVFVDHSHTFEDVLWVCQRLAPLVAEGGFVLFHDFNDPRNADASRPDYGVSMAVYVGLPADEFDFYGVFGSTALYRKQGLGESI